MSDRRSGSPIGATVTEEQLSIDPHGVHHRLRPNEPVSWLPVLGGWLVTGRAAAIEVLRDDGAFTVDDPRFATARVLGPSMLSLDGAEHVRHRRPFAAAFGRDVELFSWVRSRAHELVSAVGPSGRAELREAVAAPLAVGAIREALEIRGVAEDELLGWYRDIVSAVSALSEGRGEQPAGSVAYRRLAAEVEATIERRGSSLLTRAAEHLTNTEVVSNAAVILFGAIETAEGMMANAFFHLLEESSRLGAIRVDRGLLPNAIEESLRLEPAAAEVHRYTTADVLVAGSRVRRGDFIVVSLAGANRDPAWYPEPDLFDISRANVRSHLASASGPHACIGAHLARVEADVAVAALLDRLPGIGLDHAGSRGPTGRTFRKPAVVAATWSIEGRS